jgi:hypothetical protein
MEVVMSRTVQERSLLGKKEVEVLEGGLLVVRRSVLIVRIPMTPMKTGKKPPKRKEEPQPRKEKVLRLLKQEHQREE